MLIIAGGQGTRFWPESRIMRPKPLFSIDGRNSLLAATVARMQPLIHRDRIFVLAAADQAQLFRPILKKMIPKRNLVVEPEGRGTAVAITYGVGAITERLGEQAVVAVMPSDHYVTPAAAFQQSLRDAIRLARAHQAIVVIGIKPLRAESGYGYLRMGPSVAISVTRSAMPPARSFAGEAMGEGFEQTGSRDQPPGGAFKLDRFIEKPATTTALKMVRSGNYLWNAGMFVMSARTLAAELARQAPTLAEAMRSLPVMKPSQLEKRYRTLDFDSFDRVVAEKSHNLIGVRARFSWHDVGSWEGLWEALRGKGDNVLMGNVLEIGTDGVLARARDHLMVLLGVRNIVAIETPDVILIANREQSQDVRKVISELKRRGLDRYL